MFLQFQWYNVNYIHVTTLSACYYDFTQLLYFLRKQQHLGRKGAAIMRTVRPCLLHNRQRTHCALCRVTGAIPDYGGVLNDQIYCFPTNHNSGQVQGSRKSSSVDCLIDTGRIIILLCTIVFNLRFALCYNFKTERCVAEPTRRRRARIVLTEKIKLNSLVFVKENSFKSLKKNGFSF